MRIYNHLLTTTGAIAVLSHSLPIRMADLPLIFAGAILPDVVDYFVNKLTRQKDKRNKNIFHSLLLWILLLIASLFFKIREHLWMFPLGGLIHLLFDCFSNKGVYIVPGIKKRIAFNIYIEGDEIIEDNFTYLVTLSCIGLWLFWQYFKYH